MTTSALADAFGHHCWATLKLIEACRPLSDEQLATPVAGTYGSILDTLRHTVGGDRSYLSLLTDGALEQVDDETLYLATMTTVMEANDQAWQSLIAPNPDPGRDVIRFRDDGSESHAPLGIRLAQAIHHGTDHRSQICTGLTNLGIEPPPVDVWDYGRHDGRVFVSPM